MKKLIFTLVIFIVYTSTSFSQDLNKKTLCKKWYLEKYEIMWVDYDLEEKEKNDYILLKSDMTYENVDEGNLSTGTWSFSDLKNYFILHEKDGHLKFFVDKLENDEMVLNVDIKEMEGIDIHFKTVKK